MDTNRSAPGTVGTPTTAASPRASTLIYSITRALAQLQEVPAERLDVIGFDVEALREVDADLWWVLDEIESGGA